MTLIDPQASEELKKILSGVEALNSVLEYKLDQSLTDPYLDVNRFISKYNRLRKELFSLLPDDDISEILSEMSLYVYTGDDARDVATVKQLLVEVYFKNLQLMAYLQNLLELGD